MRRESFVRPLEFEQREVPSWIIMLLSHMNCHECERSMMVLCTLSLGVWWLFSKRDSIFESSLEVLGGSPAARAWNRSPSCLLLMTSSVHKELLQLGKCILSHSQILILLRSTFPPDMDH